ncbi:transposase family protein [Streptomyces sp. H27-C3]|uniref:transposase family protein n=1 Tax=Streptomyces sp. H27-C3 TaxID=3046305 RepID=UPI0032D9A4A8
MCRQFSTVCLVKSPVLEGCSGLLLAERLARLPDPRHRRGVRHPFVAVLLIAASAVVAGARSYAAIGQWARSAPDVSYALRFAAMGRWSLAVAGSVQASVGVMPRVRMWSMRAIESRPRRPDRHQHRAAPARHRRRPHRAVPARQGPAGREGSRAPGPRAGAGHRRRHRRHTPRRPAPAPAPNPGGGLTVRVSLPGR